MSSRISGIARKSVVIVADKRDADAYCSGCIMTKHRTIKVIAPFDFVRGREAHLSVIFFDRREFNATLVSVADNFCSLRTAFHPGCEKMDLLQGELAGPERTFMYVPQSRTTSKKLLTYAMVESLQSYANVKTTLPPNSSKKLIRKYADAKTILIPNSSNYFVVSCPYFGKTNSGISRLSAAPVFTMMGKTAGIVLQDCRSDVPDRDTGRIDPGIEMKVTLKAAYVRHLMMSL